ncbi:MAG: hypothetical protein LAN71_16735 [Acidobacteriia bacterium]|nr:hypothetical protein [Terriglobia bacterium]
MNGKTPAEACGLTVEGQNNWITLIQNAGKKDGFSLKPIKEDLVNIDKRAIWLMAQQFNERVTSFPLASSLQVSFPLSSLASSFLKACQSPPLSPNLLMLLKRLWEDSKSRDYPSFFSECALKFNFFSGLRPAPTQRKDCPA